MLGLILNGTCLTGPVLDLYRFMTRILADECSRSIRLFYLHRRYVEESTHEIDEGQLSSNRLSNDKLSNDKSSNDKLSSVVILKDAQNDK